MNDEQMQSLLEVWYSGRAVPPRGVREGVASVMADVPRTRQQGRWWPLPVFHRKAKAKTPTTNDMTVYQPSPIPATNGHAPIVIGRTYTMFSPVKAITAGALVFALGSAFLIAQPFGQQSSVPGAEKAAELAPPVKVTITATEVTDVEDDGCTDGSGNALETCTCNVPETCTWHASDQWSATDPRLSGTATTRATEQWWPDGGDRSLYPVFEAYAVEVVNDGGRWVGTARGAGPLGVQGYLTLTGEGGYDGFTAVVVNDPTDSDDDGITTDLAVIIEGELPPFPELPAE